MSVEFTPRSPASPKRVVRYFLSYAHDDGKLPAKLLAELDKQLKACKDFEFQRWQDTDILPGEKWHQEILKAANECDFGLLLVSPAFLGSKYIGEHELPLFVNGTKPCVPVGLCPIDFSNHDTKGLEESQIHLHSTPRGKSRKYFSDCTGKHSADFALNLYGKLKARLNKLFTQPTPAPTPAKLAATKAINNLPRSSAFFGRKTELDTIAKALLPATRTWGVLIDGTGGIGKTSLAVRAAEIATSDFDRVLFVSTKVQKLTPDGVVPVSNSIVAAYPEMLNEISQLLGISNAAEKPENERAKIIKTAIANEKVLLILDNLENLDKIQQNLLFEFVSDLPAGCKAIVTSRRRTDVDARIIRLGKLDQDAALEYLEELADGRDILKRATSSDRLHLYEETGGNPLLLRWVAGQMGRGGCRNITSALNLCRKASVTNDPLEFIFGDLLETFSEAETTALAALTYFTDKIGVKFISEVAGLTVTAAQTALADLANRALVMPDERDETFALVPMVADFLRKKRPEVMKDTGNRLEKRAYALIIENGYNNYERFPALESAWLGIAPALPLFLAGPNGRLQTLCDAALIFLNHQGHWDERISLCEKAEIKAVAAADYGKAGWRAYQIGWIYGLRQQACEVLDCASRATEHWAKANGDIRERCAAISLRATGHRLKGDYSAAVEACREALELSRGLSPLNENYITTLMDLGSAEHYSGNSPAAEEHFREALRLAREIGCNSAEPYIIGNLAAVALEQHDWAAAEVLAREALPLANVIHRQELIAASNTRLAKALMQQGKIDEALPYAELSVKIFSQLESPDLLSAQEVLLKCKERV